MKKRYIFLGVLALIIIIIGIIAFINIDNIMAIYDATQYSTEEIEKKIEENEKKTKEVLGKYNQQNIEPLSKEDSKKLADGELSEEEAINIILGKTNSKTNDSEEKNEANKEAEVNKDTGTEESKAEETKKPEEKPKTEETKKPEEKPKTEETKKPEEKPKTEETKKPEEKPKEEETKKPETEDKTQSTEKEEVDVDEQMGELIAKIYVLKAKYNNLIHAENVRVAKNFYSLPKEEQTKEKKYQMGLTFMGSLKNLQSQCDGEIGAVLSELTKLLQDNNMSTELVTEIKDSYEIEKKNKIAYFVSKYTAKESRVVDEVK